jgi:site-specific recombinase XerD
LRFDSDVLFDESPLLALAQTNGGKLFDWSRQYMDRILKRYAGLAGLHSSQSHFHVLKHSICVLLWQATHDLNAHIPTLLGSDYEARTPAALTGVA